jgi:hypothetical protein
MPGETSTPNIGLQVAAFDQSNWQVPTNFNWNLLDLLLSGVDPLPALLISGDLTVGGAIIGSIPGIIPTGLVTVPFVVTPTFNANLGLEFKITLTGNVTGAAFVNGATGPSIIVFRIVQDSSGGHSFVWPSNVRNGGIVNSLANGRSLQIFAVDSDGSLDAAGPMMYS